MTADNVLSAPGSPAPLTIAVLIDNRVTASDAINASEGLSMIPGTTVKFVSPVPGPKRCDTNTLTLVADYSLDDVPHPDILLIPAIDPSGNYPSSPHYARVLSWIRTAHETSQWTVSVCAGSLLLGAAGLLEGRRATTLWAAREMLAHFGATYVPDERWVRDGKIITAAGNSAGIDMALYLVGEIAGADMARAVQLASEYDPHPPFDSGSLAKATPATVALSYALMGKLGASAGTVPQ